MHPITTRTFDHTISRSRIAARVTRWLWIVYSSIIYIVVSNLCVQKRGIWILQIASVRGISFNLRAYCVFPPPKQIEREGNTQQLVVRRVICRGRAVQRRTAAVFHRPPTASLGRWGPSARATAGRQRSCPLLG